VAEHRLRTLSALAAEPNLRFISVWNPRFLTVLLDGVVERRDALQTRLPPERARCLEGDEPWRALWPRLQLISCWADGWAAGAAAELQRRWPGIELQPKGLLATEGMVTIPLSNEGGWEHVLAARSHFFEFLDEGDARMAHELEPGRVYEMVLTTGGGLYRYRLGDRVRMTGWRGGLPLLQFLGKVAGISDLVGEKLHEEHVASVLAKICPDGFLVPVPDMQRPHYVICVGEDQGRTVVDLVDEGLSSNPHYRYARDLGQLGPPELCILSPEELRDSDIGRAGTRKPRFLCEARGSIS
ncbi:MAG: GH3 auxin-responsive promoter family protein, partial [Verrucomicrobiota bacterium]